MITWSTPGTTARPGRTRYSETSVKATFFRGQYLIGFSGVADLGGNTEMWLLDRLSECIEDAAFSQWRQRLVRDLTTELTALGRPARQSWFSLLVVGFVIDAASGLVVPRLETISNDSDPTRLHAGRPGDDCLQFRVAKPSVALRDREVRLWAVGLPPNADRLIEVAEVIWAYRRRYPDRCLEIIKALARLIMDHSRAIGSAGGGQPFRSLSCLASRSVMSSGSTWASLSNRSMRCIQSKLTLLS